MNEPADDRDDDGRDEERGTAAAGRHGYRRETRSLRCTTGRSLRTSAHPTPTGRTMATMDLGLTGARALVGGGSRGLGGAIAEALAAEGARVAVTSRPGPAWTRRPNGSAGWRSGADLSTADGPAGAVTAAVGALGGLDLLVVNSGGPPPGRFEDLDDATWLRAIDGTLLSAAPPPAGGAAPSSATVAIRRSSSSCRARSASRSPACPPRTSCGPVSPGC